jgi:hypothetical protein
MQMAQVVQPSVRQTCRGDQLRHQRRGVSVCNGASSSGGTRGRPRPGGAEAAVSDHRARWPAGDANDPLDGGHELGNVGQVALVALVVGDEAALVLGHQQGVAELGRMPGLALADRAGVGIRQRDSRSEITRSPASRWSVWASSRWVAAIVSCSSPTSNRRSKSTPWSVPAATSPAMVARVTAALNERIGRTLAVAAYLLRECRDSRAVDGGEGL